MDLAVFCRDVRWRKPAHQIFAHTLQGLRLRAEECLFVGDDARWDVIEPRAVGIAAPADRPERDGEGKGLVQTSTQRLQGRKLFYWGMDTGGRNWQEFLSAPGNRYMEIQAGLARTQLECLPMPAGAEWAWLHLGVMRYYAGERYGALRAWEHSLAQARTPWALRNLAVLAWEEKRFDEAAEWYLAACRMRPTLLPLAVECGRLLIEAGRPHQWIEFLNELPRPIRIAPRIRLLAGQAAVQLGEWETVDALFRDPPRIDDVREGETSLSDLWFDFHERRLSAVEHVPRDEALRARVRREFPLPREFDYRLHAG